MQCKSLIEGRPHSLTHQYCANNTCNADDVCVKILENVRRAMRPNGRLIVVDSLLAPEGTLHSPPAQSRKMMVTIAPQLG